MRERESKGGRGRERDCKGVRERKREREICSCVVQYFLAINPC